MSGVDQASAILTAREKLFDAISAALIDEKVDVYFGTPYPVTSARDWVAIGEQTVEVEPKTLGRRTFEERIEFHVSIGAFRPGYGDAAARAAFGGAFALLSKIQRHIFRNDVTLGGSVEWCLPGNVQSDGITDEGDGDAPAGYDAALDAVFNCLHRVTV